MRLAITYYTIPFPPIDTCNRNYIQANVATLKPQHI